MIDHVEVHLTGYVLKGVGVEEFHKDALGISIIERNDAGHVRTVEFYPWARVKKVVFVHAAEADPSYVQLLVSGEDHFETVVKHPGTSPHAHNPFSGRAEVVEF